MSLRLLPVDEEEPDRLGLDLLYGFIVKLGAAARHTHVFRSLSLICGY